MNKLQLILDTVYDGLWTQNCKSVRINENGREMCQFRGDNGAKCSAGWLIEDDDYFPEMEQWMYSLFDTNCGNLYYNLTHKYFAARYNRFERNFISTLQTIHDSYKNGKTVVPGENFRQYINRRFASLAQDFGLQFVSRGE